MGEQMKRWGAAMVVVGELGTAAAVGVMVCFGLDAIEGRIAAALAAVGIGLILLAV